MKLQGNLDKQLLGKTNPHTPRYRERKKETAPPVKEEIRETAAAADEPCENFGFTIHLRPLEDSDLSLVDETILSHLIKLSQVTGKVNTRVKVPSSYLEKKTKVEHKTTLREHLEGLEKKGYFTIERSTGISNVYVLDITKIETDFKFRISDYYSNYKNYKS